MKRWQNCEFLLIKEVRRFKQIYKIYSQNEIEINYKKKKSPGSVT